MQVNTILILIVSHLLNYGVTPPGHGGLAIDHTRKDRERRQELLPRVKQTAVKYQNVQLVPVTSVRRRTTKTNYEEGSGVREGEEVTALFSTMMGERWWGESGSGKVEAEKKSRAERGQNRKGASNPSRRDGTDRVSTGRFRPAVCCDLQRA